MTRAFYAWSGGTDRDHEALAWFSAARPEQMGPHLARFRGGFTAPVLAKVALLDVVVCLALIAMLALLAPGGVSLAEAGATVAIVGLVFAFVMGSFSFAARRYLHDVHRHGLVLFAPGGAPPQVIPWATIDPGKTFVGMTVRSGVRMPVALHRQHAAVPPAVMINGWTNRPRGGVEVVEAVSGGLRHQPMASDSPFGWWQLGERKPAAFLAAIEAAMVADGYPAAGLTRFAMGRQVTARDMRRDPSLQLERMLTDPVIGLPPGRNGLVPPAPRP